MPEAKARRKGRGKSRLTSSSPTRIAQKRRAKYSRKEITYHGRSGHPLIHESETGKNYIMVRRRGGGTKRLYEGAKYRVGRTEGEIRILRLRR